MKSASKLTQEQKDLLLLLGSPDDGSQTHPPVADGARIIQELLSLGLVYYKGKNSEGKDSYDLTDNGEAVYDALAGK